MNISSFFHQASHLCRGNFHHHFRDWSARLFRLPLSEYPESYRPLSVVRTSYPGAIDGHCRYRRFAPRTTNQWRRRHALYVFAGHSRRRDDSDDHVRAGHGPRQSASASAEPSIASAAAIAAGSAAPRRNNGKKLSPDDLLMVVHLESPDNRYDMLYLANLAILQVKTNWAASLASATYRSSARVISACAYGSTKTNWLRTT